MQTGTMSLADARRTALVAQGLAGSRPAPGTRIDARHVRGVVRRVGVLQIDSVNVLVRSHELPLFSRLGPHPRHLLPRLAYGPRRELFEYWGHEASYLPVALHPLLRWRMEQARAEAWGRMVRIQRDHPGLVQEVLAEVAERGPLTAGELSAATRGTGSWWGWGDAKTAIEWLFWSGEVSAVGRRGNFERVYDLTSRALPPQVLAAHTPPAQDARRELVRFATARLGVGTAKDIADYFRLRTAETRLRLAELAEAGAVVPVRVESWREPAYLSAEASVPLRPVRARALLSPFDSLVWARPRVERLFGMRLRLEVYTPAPKRLHGYYVLPFLLDEQLVARVDLKADRRAGVLRVLGAHSEPGADAAEVAPALAAELRDLAAWLGLGTVVPGEAGDLSPTLGPALA